MNAPRWDFKPLLILSVVAWITIALVYTCVANAATQVYLEGEDDLGNGFKLCHYSEGITITVPSHKLCALSITIPD